MYPPYCSGSVYTLTPNMAKKTLGAYKTSNLVKLWIDDAFMTGTLIYLNMTFDISAALVNMHERQIKIASVIAVRMQNVHQR